MRLQQTTSEETPCSRLSAPPRPDSVTASEAGPRATVVASERRTRRHVTPVVAHVASPASVVTSVLLTTVSWCAIAITAYCGWWCAVSTDPFPLFAVEHFIGGFGIIGVFALAALPFLFPLHPRKVRRFVMTIVSLVAIMGISWIPTGSPRQQFLMRFEGLRDGMTVAEVRRCMGEKYPLLHYQDSEPWVSEVTEVPDNYTGVLSLYPRTPFDGYDHAAWTTVTFQAGHLTDKSFFDD